MLTLFIEDSKSTIVYNFPIDYTVNPVCNIKLNFIAALININFIGYHAIHMNAIYMKRRDSQLYFIAPFPLPGELDMVVAVGLVIKLQQTLLLWCKSNVLRSY